MRIPPVLAATVLLGGCATFGSRGGDPDRFDLVITNGRIVDGTGAAWHYGDVGVRRGRIVRVAPRGALAKLPAREKLDANGLVIAPGFIDIQGHSRGYLLRGDARVIGKVSQGVTTEIVGEGTTDAPLSEAMLGELNPQDSVGRRFGGPRGFDAWLTYLDRRGIGINLGAFVGGNTLREYGMGAQGGPATPEAMAAMKGALERAMQDGALGLATALIYPPGAFANTEELIELSKVMSPYGGLYITHMRSEGDDLLEAVDEAIRIGREGGVPVEIFHLKAAGTRNHPKGPEAIARIDAARAEGLDVQADMYPYTAGATGLSSCLPPSADADGRVHERLGDPAVRAQIRAEVEQPTSKWENLCTLSGTENVLIAAMRPDSMKQYGGKRLSEIATMRGKDWLETAMDLIQADQGRVETIYFMMSEENVALNLRQPWIKIGTDAGGPNPATARGLVHPRAYGTFPRILGRYVREQRILTLEDAVRRMTSATAERVGIRDRGLIKVGMWADLVIFDPQTIIDNATFEQPHQVSTGVRATYVNGVAVWRDGAHTGALPGRALRGAGYRRNRAP